MAGISIPGVTDTYKTGDLIASLMEAERIPLKQEQAALESYKQQMAALGFVSSQVSLLRESARSLFSFENPFVEKSVSSSDEGALSASAARNAEAQSFRVDVVNLATRDRFLSAAVAKDADVAAGTYRYAVGEREVRLDWKGGALSDFVAALNKRGGDTVHANVINVSKDTSVMLLESMKTGAENQLLLADAAVQMAEHIGMIGRAAEEGSAAEEAGPETPGGAPRGSYAPVNPVELAGDAKIKYQGITVTRPTNTIDDLVPGVTLNVRNVTEKPVEVTIRQSGDTAKESIIDFVGRYNRTLGELNVLTQNPTSSGQAQNDVIAELAYLGREEQDEARKRLGMFQGDFTLTTMRNALMSIVSDRYNIAGNSTVTMLANLGISTRADTTQSLTNRNLRGYLQIDEGKLDAALKDHMGEIKNLFGFDSDGDLIIDAGIAFRMDKQLTPYTQRNGILADRANTINTRITGTETRIGRLESRLEDREAELRSQYSQMEAALNSLESQSNSMQNLGNQGKQR